MAILWVLSNYTQTILENLMISRIAHLSLATLISLAIGISPISVMAADPAPASESSAAPAATPTEKATEQKAKKAAKKEKKAEKKSKKKSKKKAKPAADAATQ
jgi:hypothetical protein